jgi:hypothetical protein
MEHSSATFKNSKHEIEFYESCKDEVINNLSQLAINAGSVLYFKHKLNDYRCEDGAYMSYYEVIKRCNEFLSSHDTTTQERIYDFEGAVYCISVPNEIFYVRRDGKPVWTGNSRASGPVVQLTRQPAEGRSRDGGLRFGRFHFAKKRGLITRWIIFVWVINMSSSQLA